MIKTHTFLGVKYDIHIGAVDGLCEPPKQFGTPNFLINVDPSDSSKFLEVLIHEALHACKFETQEVLVNQTAKDITRLLRRVGFHYTPTTEQEI